MTCAPTWSRQQRTMHRALSRQALYETSVLRHESTASKACFSSNHFTCTRASASRLLQQACSSHGEH